MKEGFHSSVMRNRDDEIWWFRDVMLVTAWQNTRLFWNENAWSGTYITTCILTSLEVFIGFLFVESFIMSPYPALIPNSVIKKKIKW